MRLDRRVNALVDIFTSTLVEDTFVDRCILLLKINVGMYYSHIPTLIIEPFLYTLAIIIQL